MHSLFVTAVALVASAGSPPAIALPSGGLSRAVLAPVAGGTAVVGVSVDQPGPDGYSCSEVTPERAVLARSAGDQLVTVATLEESLDGLGVC